MIGKITIYPTPPVKIPVTPEQRAKRLFKDGPPTVEQVAEAILNAEYDALRYPDIVRHRHGGINRTQVKRIIK